MELILASSSRYRCELLATLGLEFRCVTPAVDERPLPEESAAALVARLAQAKARRVAESHEAALVIGSDQSVALDGEFLGKPHSEANAIAQLKRLRGRTATFYTGLCLINSAADRCQVAVEAYSVSIRALSDAEIAAYVSRDRPLDCVGAFRSEGLGIALFSRMRGDDPNTLVGLPLIRLVEFLGNEGVRVLG